MLRVRALPTDQAARLAMNAAHSPLTEGRVSAAGLEPVVGIPPAPDPGQLVRVRMWVVGEVLRDSQAALDDRTVQHHVSLVSVDDDATGEELQVIWEIESLQVRAGDRGHEFRAQGRSRSMLASSSWWRQTFASQYAGNALRILPPVSARIHPRLPPRSAPTNPALTNRTPAGMPFAHALRDTRTRLTGRPVRRSCAG